MEFLSECHFTLVFSILISLRLNNPKSKDLFVWAYRIGWNYLSYSLLHPQHVENFLEKELMSTKWQCKHQKWLKHCCTYSTCTLECLWQKICLSPSAFAQLLVIFQYWEVKNKDICLKKVWFHETTYSISINIHASSNVLKILRLK